MNIHAEESKSSNMNQPSVWHEIHQKCRRMWPFVWPNNNCKLQIRVVICLATLIFMRILNVFIPLLQKTIVNSLTDVVTSTKPGNTGFDVDITTESNNIHSNASSRWDLILAWIFMKQMQGENGYLNIVKNFLWIAVSQETRKRMRIKLFSHLHCLSVRWHLQRKTGEVLRVIDRGVTSINTVLSQFMFNLVPVVFDVVIAVIFFAMVFNLWTGLIVFGTMLAYGACTIGLSEWRTKFRRNMNDLNNKLDASSVDSILNFETVKYYAAEEFEVQRYSEAVDAYLASEQLVYGSLSLVNFIQKTVMGVGLMGGSLLCAHKIQIGEQTVGDFVLFVSYIDQLYGSLNLLGMHYRLMLQAFIDMENMFELLDVKQEVVDVANAELLKVVEGEIRFENVTFQYIPQKPLLNSVSFTVPPGKTYALVGPSGGGKSTIIRLLLRFYDLHSGHIFIDNQDTSKVSQKSLRQQVGIVPQDTVLFNNHLAFNIRYGNMLASDDQVELAAKSADIDDFVASLPEGYETLVGEKGMKLSGGEKQRIAIARTLLKDPKIVLLDEATSALDTRTERNIQGSLNKMCNGRTTIMVAHRLSTVIDADQILVISNGMIVEQGSHKELLQLGKIYAGMWKQQCVGQRETTKDAAPSSPENISCNFDPHNSSSPSNRLEERSTRELDSYDDLGELRLSSFERPLTDIDLIDYRPSNFERDKNRSQPFLPNKSHNTSPRVKTCHNSDTRMFTSIPIHLESIHKT